MSIRLSLATREFLVHQSAEGHSPRTIQWYDMCFRRFERFAGSDLDLDAALARLREYSIECQKSGLSSSSVAAYIRSMKALFLWSFEEGYLEKNPHRLIPKVKERQRVPEPLTDAEIRRTVNALPLPRSFTGARNRTIFFLMFDTAIRLHEVPLIKISDLHLPEREIRLLGKGQKERVIPISDSFLHELRRYLTFREALLQTKRREEERLFLTRTGSPLSLDGVRMAIRTIAKRSGVHVHPHKLRHTSAMKMSENGIDAFSLQVILGHSTMATTLRYVHAAKAKIGRRHNQWSPLEAEEKKKAPGPGPGAEDQ